MSYKIKSPNTMNYLAFHDCVISRAEWEGTTLMLYFDWIDVLKSHPDNDTGKAMGTENAVLRFENAKVLKSVYYDMSRVFEEMKRTGRKSCSTSEADIVDKDILELCDDFLILQDTLTFENGSSPLQGVYTWNCIGDSEFTVEFDRVFVCWNEFKDMAWFEGWNKNKDIHVKLMTTEDKTKPEGQSEYPLPCYADIYNKLDEMNGSTKSWMHLMLSEEKNETLHITCTDENTFACVHGSVQGGLYLSEDKISDEESFLSYDAFEIGRDIRISKAGIKGAVYRFYKYNGVSECIQWQQNNEKFWE